MKRKLSFLFLLPLLFAACENVLPVEEVDLSSMVAEFVTPVETITYEGHVVDVDYFVSSADLATYLELQPNSPNGIKRPIKSVEAKGPNADVTLMYVVNYDKGWEIISADKRAQPVLAFSEGGEFSFETANPGEKIWLECLACDVLNLRTADKALQTRAVENNPNVGFWRGLELRKEIMDEDVVETRAFGDSLDFSFDPIPILPFPLPEGGHYEFSHTYETYTLETEVGHMITTAWHQWSPWNVKCPQAYDPASQYGQYYVPAGCTALAVAQLIYYMHNKVGVPTMAPTNAYFTGQYNPNATTQNYTFTLRGMHSIVWNYMAQDSDEGTTATNYVASFLAHVGYLSDMDYKDNGSGAWLEDALNGAMATYGLTGEYLDYDEYRESRIVNNLRDSLPVCVAAYKMQNDTLSGHSFVIDGYRDYKITYNDVSYWVWDVPQDPNGPQIKVPNVVRSRQSNDMSCRYVCMNWGWGDGYDSNTDNSPIWYSLTGNWNVEVDDGVFNNYNLYRNAIVDVQPLNL